MVSDKELANALDALATALIDDLNDIFNEWESIMGVMIEEVRTS